MDSTVTPRLAVILAASVALALPATPEAVAVESGPSTCSTFESIAHRGFRPAGVAENSLEAFQQGAARGLSLELDVRADADGRLWVFHDPNARRATGVDRNFASMHTEEVRRLRYRAGGAPLLTLRQAMDVFVAHPSTSVYIEPKDSDVAESVARTIIARDRTGNTWLTGKTSTVRRSYPEVLVVQKLATGYLPEAQQVVASGVDAVALTASALTRETVDKYHAAGLAVQARNTRSTMRWRRAIAAGADGQLTDLPLALRRFCPDALRAPSIRRATSTRSSGTTTVLVRGRAFYDARAVRLGRRLVTFTQTAGRRIVVHTPRKTFRGTRVTVVTPTGTARHLVSR